ncbi:MAG: FAD-dependent oxidoreductase [Phycisphaeraceae bacterium]|nr:FAD-dependent oxidoreductase [Phycisphaeraceae bacterium]
MTDSHSPLALDVLVIGGGVAGLWLLDSLTRQGYRGLLLEAHQLGSGQTVASQGILHGGLKYTLSNLVDPGAKAVAQMPLIWRDALAGKREPNLSKTKLRADFCHLWRTGSARSRLGMTGAGMVLRVKPKEIPKENWPQALKNLQGQVYNLPEQVIDTASFLTDLASKHTHRLLKIDADNGVQFKQDHAGNVTTVHLTHGDQTLSLAPKQIVLTAGKGNATLRKMLNLDEQAMQIRPLHMVMVKGDLPKLNGHCTDFSQTRITVTSAVASDGKTVWTVGGQASEDGVKMTPEALISHVKSEILAVVPNVDLTNAQWATYRVDRAERHTTHGRRPEGVTLIHDANVITAWPTKLVLAPQLADDVIKQLSGSPTGPDDQMVAPNWPRPTVARPPWEKVESWLTVN